MSTFANPRLYSPHNATEARRRYMALAIASLCHIALIVALSLRWIAPTQGFADAPIAVEFIGDAPAIPSLQSTPPAPPEIEPTIQPPPPEPTPPAPAPASKAKVDAPPTPTGLLDNITSDLASPRQAAPSPASPAAAARVRGTIDVTIKAAVSAHWNRCNVSGLDVDKLITTVRFRLAPSGAVTSYAHTETTGVTASNRFQVQRHQECAKKSIELAAPFDDLPLEHYEMWANYKLDFLKK